MASRRQQPLSASSSKPTIYLQTSNLWSHTYPHHGRTWSSSSSFHLYSGNRKSSSGSRIRRPISQSRLSFLRHVSRHRHPWKIPRQCLYSITFLTFSFSKSPIHSSPISPTPISQSLRLLHRLFIFNFRIS